MKCPNCKNEMTKGALMDDGQKWFSGIIAKLSTIGIKLGYEFVLAYRCPNCGKVELTTQVEK